MKKLAFIIIILGLFILSYDIFLDIYNKNNDEILIKDFFSNYNDKELTDDDNVVNSSKNNNYLAVIEIPNISLTSGVVMGNSSYSTLNHNITIDPNSDLPDTKSGNFVLFGHTGTSRVSYFNNISKLKKEDKIYIYYNKVKYTYKVINKYEILMTDRTILNKYKDKSIITLITCKKGNNKYRTIIVGEQCNDK